MHIKIGTRSSELALAQAKKVENKIKQKYPHCECEFVTFSTTGDRNPSVLLAEIGGKGLFVKEIEIALIENEINIAVHAYKDIPAFSMDGLIIPGVLERVSPYDSILFNDNINGAQGLVDGMTIGTSSIRRALQLKKIYSNLNFEMIRGNVGTRISKLRNSGKLDAIILAEAGLLNLQSAEKREVISPDIMVPAPCQGIICMQCREDDEDMINVIKSINHVPSHICSIAERAFVMEINGSCFTPEAAFCEIDELSDFLRFRCMLATDECDNIHFLDKTVRGISTEAAVKLGEESACQIKHVVYG